MRAVVTVAFRITLWLYLYRGRGPRPELRRPFSGLQLSTFSVTLRTCIGRLLCHLVFFSASKVKINITLSKIKITSNYISQLSPTR